MAIKYAIIRVNDNDPDDITLLLEAEFADTVAESATKLAHFGQRKRHAKVARRAAEHASTEIEARLKAATIRLP